METTWTVYGMTMNEIRELMCLRDEYGGIEGLRAAAKLKPISPVALKQKDEEIAFLRSVITHLIKT